MDGQARGIDGRAVGGEGWKGGCNTDRICEATTNLAVISVKSNGLIRRLCGYLPRMEHEKVQTLTADSGPRARIA